MNSNIILFETKIIQNYYFIVRNYRNSAQHYLQSYQKPWKRRRLTERRNSQTWGTSMTPTVIPAMRSTWRYSRHLYVRIHRKQGRNSSSHSIHVMLTTFDFHLSSAAHGDAFDDDDDDVVSGCCKGIIRTGLVVVGMEEEVEDSPPKSELLGDA